MFHSKLGHGTTFSVFLPEARGPRTVQKGERAPLMRGRGTETVLIVEDEDQIRDMVGEYLQQNGYTVLRAQNGQEALQIAERYKGLIHLLITDVVMPELGGPGLAEQLKRLRPRTKVLLTSGYPDGGGNQKPAEQYLILEKPFALSVLAKKIREALDRPQQRSAASEP